MLGRSKCQQVRGFGTRQIYGVLSLIYLSAHLLPPGLFSILGRPVLEFLIITVYTLLIITVYTLQAAALMSTTRFRVGSHSSFSLSEFDGCSSLSVGRSDRLGVIFAAIGAGGDVGGVDVMTASAD